jgi:hypothetical protein
MIMMFTLQKGLLQTFSVANENLLSKRRRSVEKCVRGSLISLEGITKNYDDVVVLDNDAMSLTHMKIFAMLFALKNEFLFVEALHIII